MRQMRKGRYWMRERLQYSVSAWSQSQVRPHRSFLDGSFADHGSIYGGSKSDGCGKGEYDFSKSQPWVNTARNLTFLDETPELISIYDHAAEPETDYTAPEVWQDKVACLPSPATLSESARSYSTAERCAADIDRARSTSAGHMSFTDLSTLNSPSKRRRLNYRGSYHGSPASTSSHALTRASPSSSWQQASPNMSWTPTTIQEMLNSDTSSARMATTFTTLEPAVSFGSLGFSGVSKPSSFYSDTPVWPLQSKEQAFLLRHYVENLARNFDLVDPHSHFRKVVPQRAATCPTLLNAIFALSARHLSRIGDYDQLVSNRYQQECLKHLIPMLDDLTVLLDENLLASTIILRHLEEIEVPLSGQSPADQSSHLFGAHAFIQAQERATITGGLRNAAFWTGLRQEIYVAFVNQRPIIPLELCNIDRSLKPASDDVWACRMIVLCADIIRWCFGPDDRSIAAYNSLSDGVEQWHARKPASYTPVFQKPAGPDAVFPELWFVGDDVMTALQHYHLARILLASYDPNIPRLGPGRAPAFRAMDDEIREHVRAMCGTCWSNSASTPSFIYAAMGVAMAGDKFTERREQDAMLELLATCDRKYGWPTGAAAKNLRLAWGWQ